MIRPSDCRESEAKDALCRPLPAFASEHIEIARMRIAPQPLLDLKRQAIGAAAHIGVADCQPYANTARNRDHRRDSALTTAAANAAGTEPGIRTRTSPANSTSITASLSDIGGSAGAAELATDAISTGVKPPAAAVHISWRQR
jgi:hypothetical protein